MSEEIVWVILRRNGAEEARQASNQNLALVLASSPAEARTRASAASPYGESYMCPHGYAVVSLSAFMTEMGGTVLVKGDLPNPVVWPKDSPWVF